MRPGYEYDTWWHLAAGRWMVSQRELIRTDVFSWTAAGEPWVRPGLLADVGLYLLHALGGAPLVNVVTALVFAGAFVVVWPLTASLAPFRRLLLMILAILCAVVAAVPRPLVASVLLLAIVVRMLHDDRRRPGRGVWVLPLVMVLWVNLHGAFVVGLAVILLHAVMSVVESVREGSWAVRGRARRLAAVASLSVGAVPLNPFGVPLLWYAPETLRLSVLRDFVHEWRQPVPWEPQFFPLFVLLTVVSIVILRGRAWRSPVHALELVAFAALAATAARHAALLAVVAPAAIGGIRTRGSLRREEDDGRVRSGVWWPGWAMAAALSVFLGLVNGTLSAAANRAADAHLLPLEALDAVATGHHGRTIWNAYDYGGYLIWSGSPQGVRVSIDGRTDLFGDDRVRQHLQEWAGHVDLDDPKGFGRVEVAVSTPGSPLLDLLTRNGWCPVPGGSNELPVALARPQGGSCP